MKYILATMVLLSPFVYMQISHNTVLTQAQNPRTGLIEGITPQEPITNKPIDSFAVDSFVSYPIATIGDIQQDIAETLTLFETIKPKKNNKPKYQYVGLDGIETNVKKIDLPEDIKSIQTTIAAGTTVTNITNTGGNLFIPADPHGAAGPNHVVNVFNTTIEFYQKNGTQDYSDTLQNFFAALTPANFTFDPKVVYDQFEDRWVVVTLERTDTGSGDPTNTSLVLVAVSDDSDPNGNWTVTEINTSINIGGDLHWLDYPGLAVDDQAIYITGNMFQYFGGTSNPGSNGGNRLVIIDKGVAGGFYGGGAVSASIYDPTTTLGAFLVTQIPAQIYGTTPAGVGTWLIGYSGLAGGGNSAVQLIRIDNPLGAISFSQQVVFFGTVDGLTTAIPNAPQSGTAIAIDSGDRRVIDTVWRNDSLYFTTEVQSNDVNNLNEATAFWGQIDTGVLSTPTFTQGNIIGGESDIGTGTHTSYASIAVNSDDGITVGFSGSNSNIFPSSYFVHQSPIDPLNSMRPAQVVSPGVAFYVRTFGGPSNRWGDYSATSVDPDEACFWIYNKHAISQGNATTGGEVGRWGTTHAHFCNDNPVANTDTAAVDQGMTATTVNGAVTSLIANDTDVDPDDTLSMNTTAVSGPSNGSVTLNTNGTFSYTHNGTATTTDAFDYQVCDDGSPSQCDDGTVNITITLLANISPTAVDDSFSVDEGATATTLTGGSATVLNNDTDPDDATLTATINSPPANASAFTLNSDGTFSYTHDGSETTTDSFTYDACDDELPTNACDTATVNITINPINDAPVANNDAFALDEGASATTLTGGSSTVLNNDTDPDDAVLTATINTSPANASAFTLNSDGTFSYTHDGSETTTDSFTYDACDDELPTNACDTATVNITINPINDAPVANNDAFALDEGASTTALTGGSSTVLNNDTDTDDAVLTAIINSPPANASAFTLNSDGTFSYTHDGSETTTDSFTYDACDDELPTNACDTATVNITINPINDAPVANDDAFVLDEGASATTLTGGSSTVLNNDTDPDDAVLTATINTSPANASAFTLNSDGTFSYTHDGSETTTDSFTYDACDDELPTNACDTATVNITINPINDAPVANDDAFVLDEGASATILTGGSSTVLNNDTDPDDAALTAIINSPPANASAFTLNSDGTFSYTHDGSETTTDSFTYDACDDELPTNACDTATVNITINPINDAPVANDDTATAFEGSSVSVVNGNQTSLLQNDDDIENHNLSLITAPITPPTNGTVTLNITGNGTFSYTHNGNSATSDSFVYQVCDDGSPVECSNATVNISILSIGIFSDGFEN